MESFSAVAKKRFTVSKVIIDGDIMFNGCVISQKSDNQIALSMKTDLERIRFMNNVKKDVILTGERLKMRQLYRRSAGELVWVGYAALP